MRPAVPGDRDALLALLRGHETSSMFGLVNLLGQGAAMRVWVAGDGAADLAGMVGLTEDGMALPQWPGGDWAAVARAWTGAQVSGLLGPADQVAPLRRALGLDGVAARHASAEPGFRLTLRDLALPDCDGFEVRPITGSVADTVRQWRAAYEQEVFAVPAPEAADRALRAVARWQVAGSHRVLWQGDAPVALTGFNAVLPDVVQVGGVYVPPGLRGKGLARRAVGLHLAQVRTAGVQRAVLFAASEAAARAYVSLGFQPAGWMGLVLFDAPQGVA